ncbi:MAG: response regulator transcription factor [Anaerolineales bacterium]|nr:response regulator transcription factor [Anaerolineales bacterium]
MFLNEGRPLLYLLNQITPRSSYIAHLLAQSEEGSVNESLVDPLTERELEILHLVAQGATNRDIAEQLVISLGTVKGHLNHILSKLDAQNRTEAVALGRELRLL